MKLLVVLFVEVWFSCTLKGMGTLKVLSESSSRKWILPGRRKQQPNSQGEKKQQVPGWAGLVVTGRSIHRRLLSQVTEMLVHLGPAAPSHAGDHSIVHTYKQGNNHCCSGTKPQGHTSLFLQRVLIDCHSSKHFCQSQCHSWVNIPPQKTQRVATMFPPQTSAHQWSKRLVDSKNLETKQWCTCTDG